MAYLIDLYLLFSSNWWSSREALWPNFENLSYPETPLLTSSRAIFFQGFKPCKFVFPILQRNTNILIINIVKREASGHPSAHTPSPQGRFMSLFYFFYFFKFFYFLALKLTNPIVFSETRVSVLWFKQFTFKSLKSLK